MLVSIILTPLFFFVFAFRFDFFGVLVGPILLFPLVVGSIASFAFWLGQTPSFSSSAPPVFHSFVSSDVVIVWWTLDSVAHILMALLGLHLKQFFLVQ